MKDDQNAILTRVRELVDQGNFDAARDVISEARKAARCKETALVALRGDLSSLMGEYGGAALEFTEAADPVHGIDPALHLEYMTKRGAALADLAEHKARTREGSR
jgi:hypothetical protein